MTRKTTYSTTKQVALLALLGVPLTAASVARILGVEPSTALRRLNRLLSLKLVQRAGRKGIGITWKRK